ncbi:hypothetical protein ACS5PK_15165 [Roseateles sp. DB2]|uniref:hypothetical protein n=1 Tax=Roseateles sp. DB2 TaxID=3453717 RepID=UPI003EEC0DEE
MNSRITPWQDLTPAALRHRARLVWQALRALGKPGVLAALCLLCAGVLALQLTPRWQDEAEELAVQQAALRRSLRSNAPRSAVGADSPAALLAALPPSSQRQQRLADLLEIGLRLGLVQQRSEQRLSVDADTGLERLRVSMPVQGSYAQLRPYLGAALAHDPALSLDSLRLRRAERDSQTLQAELVWTLHSRREREALP